MSTEELKEEKHFHICEMHLRVPSCKVKTGKCQTLKVDFDKTSLPVIPITERNKETCQLPKISGICDNKECELTFKLDQYKMQLEEAKGDNLKLKAINTQFRTLLLMPNTARDLLEKGNTDFNGIDSIINRQRPTYEQVGTDTMLYLVQYHQRFLEDYMAFCAEKLGKLQIKDHIVKNRKIENAKFEEIEQARIDKEKAAKGKKYIPKTPYEKAMAMYTKNGIPVEDAEKIVLAMGIKKEITPNQETN